jgi:hypothetical protein
MAAAVLASWLCGAASIASAGEPARAAEPARDDPSIEESHEPSQSTLFDAPFPDLDITEAVRVHARTLFAPDASIGSGRVSLVRPELSLRATAPANDRLVLRLTVRATENNYALSGDAWGGPVLLPSGASIDADRLVGHNLDLHAARMAFEGAYRLSEHTGWIADREQWGVVGALSIGSRWEDGAFRSGLVGVGAIGFGYEIPDVLRLALGVSLQSPLDHGALDANPFFSLRWRPTERVTVRSRELGLQVAFRPDSMFEVYVTGFRSSDRFRLRDRIDPLGDMSFRDRQVRLGAGFDCRLANWLRMGVEAGALTDRSLRITEEDLGTLVSRRVDPSAYVELRMEVRM